MIVNNKCVFLNAWIVFLYLGIAWLSVSCSFVEEKANISNSFLKYYGEAGFNKSSRIVQTPDGGYAIIGTTSDLEDAPTSTFLIRTDASGNQLWQKKYRTLASDTGYALLSTPDEGFLLATIQVDSKQAVSAGGLTLQKSKALIMKTNKQGEIEWKKVIERSDKRAFAYHLFKGTDDLYYMVGAVTDEGSLIARKILIERFNLSGESVNIDFDPSGIRESDNYATNGFMSSEGRIVMAAYSSQELEGFSGTPIMVTLNSQGGIIDAPNRTDSRLNITSLAPQIIINEIYKIIPAPDGGYFACGTCINLQQGNFDAFVMKMDKNYKVSWFKNFGDVNFDSFKSLIIAKDGHLLAVGLSRITSQDWDVYVVKMSENGSLLWEKKFGGPNIDFAEDVVESAAGGFAVLASFGLQSNKVGGSNAIALLKITDAGELKGN